MAIEVPMFSAITDVVAIGPRRSDPGPELYPPVSEEYFAHLQDRDEESVFFGRKFYCPVTGNVI